MKITEIATAEKVQKIIRLAAYCRVSSDSKDQLHSFAAQIRYYTDYVNKHPQYELVDIYADEGLTGTCISKRDDFNRLIRDCKKGKIDRIVTKSVARFARNTQDLLTVLRMLKENGIGVYFEEQGIDTDKMNMEMIVTFPGMVAQQESVSISGNMRWSYKKRMESGDFNCCAPAYGYDLKNGQLTVNELEAVIVQRIFNLYLQGIGKQAIANILNEDAVPRKHDGQSKWHVFTIDYILNNERYMGDALLQKSFTTETLPFRKIRNRGEMPKYYVENSNPSIISREIYQAAQALQKAKATTTAVCKRSYTFSGVLHCPDCGHTLRRQIVRKKAYWICSYKAAGRSSCNNYRISEDDVSTAFGLMVKKLISNRKTLFETLIHQIETMQSMTSENQQKIYQIDKDIADLAAKNHMIAKLHTKGILCDADYMAQSGEIAQKLTALRVERRKKLSEDENDEWLDAVRTLNEILTDYELKDEFDEELFEQIIESVTVISGTELHFKLIGGITLPEKITKKGASI